MVGTFRGRFGGDVSCSGAVHRIAHPSDIRDVGDAFDRLLTAILLLAAAAVISGARYNFRIVGIRDIYDFRDSMASPAIVNYLVTIVSSALLPFAFAGFIARKAYCRAGVALLLLLLFYPVTLSKLALFAPLWLIAVLLLSRIFDAKTTVIMSLLVPVLSA